MQTLYKKYLVSTPLIESDHPQIISQARKLTNHTNSNQEKIRSIFYFVRDEIKYNFGIPPNESAVKASMTLKARKGFCTQKAILFCSLARSCSIPSAINFYDIIDHTLSNYIAGILKTKKLIRHGVPAVKLNNTWKQYDATLDIHLIQKKGLKPVEFSADRDCMMHSTTKNGNKHIEYVHDYGLTHDVTYQQIRYWMKKGYPHLFNE